MGIRAIHHINCATLCPFAGHLLGQNSWRGKMVAHCLVIETDKDGLILVDTGFGMADIEGRTGMTRGTKVMLGAKFDPAETAIAQVEALGFRASDVKHIVVTHLDLDHAGGLPDFPDAKVHLHAKEHAAAMARATLLERNRYIKGQWAHGPKWEVYAEDGDTWRGLPAITKLRGLDADVALLPMHGHTRGHSAVIAKTPGNRWIVHAGDAYFHRHSMEGGSVPIGFRAFERITQIIPSARCASAAALRQLKHTYADVDLFCAHDPDEFERMARA